MSKWVVITGDIHIGAKTVDIDVIKDIAKRRWRGKPIMLMGDLIDAGIDRGMQFDNKINPQQQFDEISELLKPLNVVNALIGNHEARIFKAAGLNIYKMLGYPEQHNITLEGVKFYLTHGKGGAQNPLTEFVKYFKFVDADFICMGHNHDLGKWSILRGGKVTTLIRTGSFLKDASYALQNGYPPMINGWVEVNLDSKYARILSLQHGEVKEI